MFMMNLLINDVSINEKYANEIGKDIKSNAGTCQGDCLSALLFIVYLARSVNKALPANIEVRDYDRIMWSDLDWIMNRDKHCVEIDPKYSDDINFKKMVSLNKTN